ncbi:MAG TPA: hypothetical protein VGI19_02180 [Candidatus Cybelea sp.]
MSLAPLAIQDEPCPGCKDRASVASAAALLCGIVLDAPQPTSDAAATLVQNA